MSTLATQQIVRTGLIPAFAAAAPGGDQFAADGMTYLHVKNGGGGSINVTCAATQVPAPGIATAMSAVAVAAGTERILGPFPPQYFADANGMVQVTYSGVTSVTVGAFKLSQP